MAYLPLALTTMRSCGNVAVVVERVPTYKECTMKQRLWILAMSMFVLLAGAPSHARVASTAMNCGCAVECIAVQDCPAGCTICDHVPGHDEDAKGRCK